MGMRVRFRNSRYDIALNKIKLDSRMGVMYKEACYRLIHGFCITCNRSFMKTSGTGRNLEDGANPSQTRCCNQMVFLMWVTGISREGACRAIFWKPEYGSACVKLMFPATGIARIPLPQSAWLRL